MGSRVLPDHHRGRRHIRKAVLDGQGVIGHRLGLETNTDRRRLNAVRIPVAGRHANLDYPRPGRGPCRGNRYGTGHNRRSLEGHRRGCTGIHADGSVDRYIVYNRRHGVISRSHVRERKCPTCTGQGRSPSSSVPLPVSSHRDQAYIRADPNPGCGQRPGNGPATNHDARINTARGRTYQRCTVPLDIDRRPRALVPVIRSRIKGDRERDCPLQACFPIVNNCPVGSKVLHDDPGGKLRTYAVARRNLRADGGWVGVLRQRKSAIRGDRYDQGSAQCRPGARGDCLTVIRGSHDTPLQARSTEHTDGAPLTGKVEGRHPQHIGEPPTTTDIVSVHFQGVAWVAVRRLVVRQGDRRHRQADTSGRERAHVANGHRVHKHHARGNAAGTVDREARIVGQDGWRCTRKRRRRIRSHGRVQRCEHLGPTGTRHLRSGVDHPGTSRRRE